MLIPGGAEKEVDAGHLVFMMMMACGITSIFKGADDYRIGEFNRRNRRIEEADTVL